MKASYLISASLPIGGHSRQLERAFVSLYGAARTRAATLGTRRGFLAGDLAALACI